MSLFSGIASLFHADAAKKEQVRGEINLMDAVDAHVKWKVRLQNYLDGRSQEKLDPLTIGRDDQCVLGKWIHGPATKHFHDDDHFHQLRADHAEFHFVAANVVKHVQDNNHSAAESLLNGDYKHISHKVVMALTELNRLVTE
jgi:Chemoreceptor zinc-binding domain